MSAMADELIILAGGFGTRLREVVADVPKPLAPVAGRPFLAWLLDRYAACGINHVVLATGYLGEKVEEVVGARWQNMRVTYSREHVPLGTGGAIKAALRHVRSDRGVHICNGDTYLTYEPVALQEAAINSCCPVAVALAHVDDISRYGAVRLVDGKISGFREKGGHGAGLINAGSYFLSAGGVAALPSDEQFSFEQLVLEPFVEAGQVAALSDTTGFIDIGVPQDFLRAQRLFGLVN
jgi:D-glycero-alpha-D-manno-heptose 1-phosphate guanylyltransferase